MLFDKTKVYHDAISPKLEEIFEVCKDEGIPFFAVACATSREETVELYTTQVVAELENLPISITVVVEFFNNPEFAKVCTEVLELQLLRKALARKAAVVERGSATIQ